MTLASILAGAHSKATAHAPWPDQVHVTSDARQVVMDLPGFGLVKRSGPAEPFRYACSALFELTPSATPPALALRADGSLLLGTLDGLRIVSPAGCPDASDDNVLRHEPVLKLALADDQRGYAVTSGEAPSLWYTEDGGRRWTKGATVAGQYEVTGLVTRAGRPAQAYLSVASALGTEILATNDHGATLVASPQTSALSLLHADTSDAGPLWAMARDAQSVGNRGFAILRATVPEGPWQTVLRVNYFGGFVVDPEGVIWIGDEIGGIYRSDDGGGTFGNLAAESDVACIAYGGGALWAGHPATPDQPSLQMLGSVSANLQAVMALADVDQLVECPGIDVGQLCASAWVEWQRDVLMRPLDAGLGESQADAGVDPDEAPGNSGASQCGLAPQHMATRGLWGDVALWLMLLGSRLALRASRFARGRRRPL